MNEFYKTRLKKKQKVLARNLYNVNLILSKTQKKLKPKHTI